MDLFNRKTVSQTLLDVFLEQGKTRVVSGMWGAKEVRQRERERESKRVVDDVMEMERKESLRTVL